MSGQAENPWDAVTRTWQDLYQQQARLGQGWLDAQNQMANALSESGGTPFDVSAFTELWRTGATGGPADPGVGSAFEKMFLPLMGGSQVTDAMRRVTQAPQLADTGGFERRMAHLMELFVEAQSASRGYEARMTQAWAEANQGFARTMAERAREPEAQAPVSAMRVWLTCVDEAFSKLQRSAEFLEAQRRLMRAGIDYLLAERELFEQMVEPAGLPTRSEIDEIHQTVQALKRRVRTLEGAVAAAREPKGGQA